MLRRTAFVALLLAATLFLGLGAGLPSPADARRIAWLRGLDPTAFAAPLPIPAESARIGDFLSRSEATAFGVPLRERAALVRFYARRGDQLAWAKDHRAVASLLDAVRGADTHGLRPADYHAESLSAAWSAADRAVDAEARVQRDLLLSDAFLHLARDLSVGAVDPLALDPSYRRGKVTLDPVEALEAAIFGGDPGAVLATLTPPHPEYAWLRAGLIRLRASPSGPGCPGLRDGPLLRLGDRDPRVPRLRACLMDSRAEAAGVASPLATGPRRLETAPRLAADPMRLDAPLVAVLRRFQQRHGLADDGILGPVTTAALLRTRAQRIDQVRLNLERWRWQPRDPGSRWLRVDVPRFRLRAFEAGASQPTLEMRVVVGRPDWKTPRVHGLITHLVLNPAWHVPNSIFVEEMLPRAQRDADYFLAEGLELREQRDGAWQLADPASVDWARVDPERVRYRVHQPPGPRNPLGRIKFIFENAYAIYLHGTPGRAALERPVRVLSHGCVRVENELALARFALAPDPAWNRERLVRELERAHMQPVRLPEPLPVHIVYFTAEADATGALSLLPDPYGWDPRLLALLGPDEPVSAQAADRPGARPPGSDPDASARGSEPDRGRDRLGPPR